MRLFFLSFLLVALFVNESSARGFLENVNRALEKASQDIGKTVDKATLDTGKTIEKAGNDAGKAAEKAVLDVVEKSKKSGSVATDIEVKDAGEAANKAVQEATKIIEKTLHDAELARNDRRVQSANSRLFLKDLVDKDDEELLALSLAADPCLEVECHGVRPDIARQAVNVIRAQKQIEVDLGVRRQQVWAAGFSAIIAMLSLVISIRSYVRSGKRDPNLAEPARTTAAKRPLTTLTAHAKCLRGLVLKIRMMMAVVILKLLKRHS